MTGSESYDEMFLADPDFCRDEFYVERNRRLLALVDGLEFKNVLELAGASGLFAEMFLDGHSSTVRYVHSDFSPVACDLARGHLKRFPNAEVKVIDLVEELDEIDWGVYDLVVSTSMEHFPKGVDLDFLQRLKRGTHVLFSLARFGPTKAGHHLHPYPHPDYVRNRFAPLLNMKGMARYKRLILYHGVRRRYRWPWLMRTGHRGRVLFDVIERHLEPEDYVLDVCCGYSPMAGHVLDLCSLMGFDVDYGAVESLKERHPEGEWLNASYTEMEPRGFSVFLLLGVDSHYLEPGFESFLDDTFATNCPRLVLTEVKLAPVHRPWMRAYGRLESRLEGRGYIRLSSGVYVDARKQRSYTLWCLV